MNRQGLKFKIRRGKAFIKKTKSYWLYPIFTPFYSYYFKKYKNFYRRYSPFTLPFCRTPLNVANSEAVIDIKRKFLYNRIPKSANTTLMAALSEGNKDKENISELQISKRYKKSHRCPSELKRGEFKEMGNIFKFLFVRNPYRRTLSAYLEKIRIDPEKRKKYLKKAPGLLKKYGTSPSFYDFCRYLDEGGLYRDRHWAPQTSLLVIPPKEFDFTGRVENIEEDFNTVASRVEALKGRKITARLGVPTGASDKLLKYYTHNASDIIYRLYREDFETFGYSRSFIKQ